VPDERRTPRPGRTRAGSRGRARPGAPGRGHKPAPQPARGQARRGRATAVAAERDEERQRSRLTGRAAILVLVLAVLAVSYASSLRAYLQQRGEIEDLQTQIDERNSAIEELEQEKERWEDPAYVAQQARARFGYVEPGETPFVVLGENGDPLSSSELDDPAEIGSAEKRTWYDEMWESVEVAGDPPTRIPPPPAKRIDGSDEGAPD